jgi:hypothetical protein
METELMERLNEAFYDAATFLVDSGTLRERVQRAALCLNKTTPLLKTIPNNDLEEAWLNNLEGFLKIAKRIATMTDAELFQQAYWILEEHMEFAQESYYRIGFEHGIHQRRQEEVRENMRRILEERKEKGTD